MDYGLLKLVHVTTVAISGAGFFARGIGMLLDGAWMRTRAARTLPHVVDTVLLVSAVMLAWQLRLSPTGAPWLMAKIVGLVIYVVLGTIALRRGRTRRTRTIAWIAGLLTFAYIVSVAILKTPAGALAAIGR